MILLGGKNMIQKTFSSPFWAFLFCRNIFQKDTSFKQVSTTTTLLIDAAAKTFCPFYSFILSRNSAGDGNLLAIIW